MSLVNPRTTTLCYTEWNTHNDNYRYCNWSTNNDLCACLDLPVVTALYQSLNINFHLILLLVHSFACLHFACSFLQDQAEAGEVVLHAVIESQLAGPAGPAGPKGGMASLEEFEGYESERLCPVAPVCYAVLAAHYSKSNKPLRARKALVLANR